MNITLIEGDTYEKKVLHINVSKHKFIVLITISIILAGILSNILLYRTFHNSALEKINKLNQITVNSISERISRQMEAAGSLAALCANDQRTIQTMQKYDWEQLDTRTAAVALQKMITDYANASLVSTYVNKLTIFNLQGALIQASASDRRTPEDWDLLMNSTILKSSMESDAYGPINLDVSLSDNQVLDFQILLPIYDIYTTDITGFVYGAFDLTMATDILTEYEENAFLLKDIDGNHINFGTEKLELDDARLTDHIMNENARGIVQIGRQDYVINEANIPDSDFCIYGIIKMSDIYPDQNTIFMIVIAIILVAVLIYFSVLGIITYLIQHTERIAEEKRNYEIAVLQSQVNPHFLYNTLNSIHWMASLQKNMGICSITEALTRLLRNMAKGGSQKIPLSTEMSLLEDYITIQSIRYMEIFDFVSNVPETLHSCKILKLTLQPLVENAIFHGIEPKKSFCTITIDAQREQDDLIITVHDTGIGMDDEKIAELFREDDEDTPAAAGGIGVRNVHNRLRLTYGERYGLQIKSEKGKYTCVSIRIPYEE